MSGSNGSTENAPEPMSEYRHETLGRYPVGHPRHREIKRFAEKWHRTGEWRFRQQIGGAAAVLIEDAQAIAENDDPEGARRDPWITAECASDLAKACKEYLEAYRKHLDLTNEPK